MKDHQRRIAEIEELADIQLDLMDQMAALKERVKDADENLVASMKAPRPHVLPAPDLGQRYFDGGAG